MASKTKTDSIFSDKPLVNYKKGKVFFQPEDKINRIYYLTRGNVKQYVLTPLGEEVIIHIFKKGSFFPIALLIGKTQIRSYFEAVTKVKARVAQPEKVIKLLKKEPSVLFNLTKRLAKGLDGLSVRLEETLGEKVNKRLEHLLVYLAKSFGIKSKNGIKIRLPLTHQDLASWLGVSRETVSRQMKLFEKRGLVSY